MTEPPPHLDPKHRDLWHAACRLLQENMGLTTFTFHIANNEATWQNSPHATRERQPQGPRGFIA